jgi:hypothetical protein
MKIRPHKIGSVVSRLGFEGQIEISRIVESRSGQVLLVRALEEKRTYDMLELTTGRMAHIGKGDVLVGALGRRAALRGFVGRVPETVKAGDTLSVLNLGGVLGQIVSENQDVGHSLKVEVLGMAVRNGKGINIADAALPQAPEGTSVPPVVVVSGTCMNAGKTLAACEIIAALTARGYAVGGVKLTGVAAQRDPLNMLDHGALTALSFVDCGLPSTAGYADMGPLASGLLRSIAEQAGGHLDVIVAEMGDGLIGSYGVDVLLSDPGFRRLIAAHVLCANDLVAAWGGVQWLAARDLDIDVIAGPATDNSVGLDYISNEIGKAAANARTEPGRLADLVEQAAFGGVLA